MTCILIMEEFTLFAVAVGLIFTVVVSVLFFTSPKQTPQKKIVSRTAAKKKGINLEKNCPAFRDRFDTLEQLQNGLRDAGLESSNLIIGIDYTKSNLIQGRKTFGGNSLHKCGIKGAGRAILNPYQQVISIVGKTLKPFDDDEIIPTFGFGDLKTKDVGVFPFYENRNCEGFEEVLKRYSEITPSIKLCGPTNFAPIIRKAIEIVKQEQGYHILIIIADGEVISVNETKNAIIEASKYPLSIICVGVGDGPFDLMEEFDDNIGQRKFDNVGSFSFFFQSFRSNAFNISFNLWIFIKLFKRIEEEMQKLSLREWL